MDFKFSLHFKENITSQHVHPNCDLKHGVVLSVPGVVTLQQVAPSGFASTGKFGQV